MLLFTNGTNCRLFSKWDELTLGTNCRFLEFGTNCRLGRIVAQPQDGASLELQIESNVARMQKDTIEKSFEIYRVKKTQGGTHWTRKPLSLIQNMKKKIKFFFELLMTTPHLNTYENIILKLHHNFSQKRRKKIVSKPVGILKIFCSQ